MRLLYKNPAFLSLLLGEHLEERLAALFFRLKMGNFFSCLSINPRKRRAFWLYNKRNRRDPNERNMRIGASSCSSRKIYLHLNFFVSKAYLL